MIVEDDQIEREILENGRDYKTFNVIKNDFQTLPPQNKKIAM